MRGFSTNGRGPSNLQRLVRLYTLDEECCEELLLCQPTLQAFTLHSVRHPACGHQRIHAEAAVWLRHEVPKLRCQHISQSGCMRACLFRKCCQQQYSLAGTTWPVHLHGKSSHAVPPTHLSYELSCSCHAAAQGHTELLGSCDGHIGWDGCQGRVLQQQLGSSSTWDIQQCCKGLQAGPAARVQQQGCRKNVRGYVRTRRMPTALWASCLSSPRSLPGENTTESLRHVF